MVATAENERTENSPTVASESGQCFDDHLLAQRRQDGREAAEGKHVARHYVSDQQPNPNAATGPEPGRSAVAAPLALQPKPSGELVSADLAYHRGVTAHHQLVARPGQPHVHAFP